LLNEKLQMLKSRKEEGWEGHWHVEGERRGRYRFLVEKLEGKRLPA
jgi:hypothetical protein